MGASDTFKHWNLTHTIKGVFYFEAMLGNIIEFILRIALFYIAVISTSIKTMYINMAKAKKSEISIKIKIYL